MKVMTTFKQDRKEPTDSWADEIMLSSLLAIFCMQFFPFLDKSIPVPSDLFSNCSLWLFALGSTMLKPWPCPALQCTVLVVIPST